MLEIKGLTLELDKKRILNDLTLSIETGASVGIVGPNGSGKTTLLQAMLGFLPLSAGTISFDGRNLVTLSATERSQTVAYVAQDTSSALPFTVGAFLELAYFPWQKTLSFAAWEADCLRLCEEFKLADKLNRNLGTLSGGERQRVILVQSLLQRPQLLLLDEITNHLDIFYQLETLQYLRRQTMTRIMVLHDINLAAQFCESVVLLKEGSCLASGPTSEVLTEETIHSLFGVSCEIMRQSGRIKHIIWDQPAQPVHAT